MGRRQSATTVHSWPITALREGLLWGDSRHPQSAPLTSAQRYYTYKCSGAIAIDGLVERR